MSSGRHRRDLSTGSSNHSAGRGDVVHETRELEHYCLMKLITSVSQMKADIDKLYAGADSLQSRIDHLEASHDAHMLELRTQIGELRARIQTRKPYAVAQLQQTNNYLKPLLPQKHDSDDAIDELSFSDIDTESLVDDGPEPEPERTITRAPPESDLEFVTTDNWDTSSHYSAISIPADWRKSRVAPVVETNQGREPEPPSLPPFLASRNSIILPEIAHLHPRRSKNIRDTVSSHCSQMFKNTQTELTDLAGRFTRLSRSSQHQDGNFILEEDERENSGSATPVEASSLHSTTPCRPERPKSALGEQFLRPLSCGEPVGTFLNPQQFDYFKLAPEQAERGFI